ncbi:MAG: bifunctional diaminohydroxyphosphoribosylaminopyrimidine deaminase/5-amino-6-(5-phosphoribosylamino)uracil reductase RibD [Desulfatibacillaceae bacterium]
MSDTEYMKMALKLARLGEGRTSPNPMVGAVVVRDGQVVGTGYHARVGEAHAEVNALEAAGKRAEGATLYVTLEPCNHTGKTPPCTEAVIRSGVALVVTGMDDPNPGVAGGGLKRLKEHGIEVRSGVMEAEARELNEFWIKWVTTGRPFVLSKCAATLDGWIATRTGHSQWITNPRSRQRVHELRNAVDAVLVGMGTVRADDPGLNVRLGHGQGKDPLRVILDPLLSIPEDARLLHMESESDTILVCAPDATPDKRRRLEKPGVCILEAPRAPNAGIDLSYLMETLGRMKVTSVMIEGGGAVHAAALAARLVDKMSLFYAPKLFGGNDGVPMFTGTGPKTMDQTLRLHNLRVSRFDEDILIEGYVGYPDRA